MAAEPDQGDQRRPQIEHAESDPAGTRLSDSARDDEDGGGGAGAGDQRYGRTVRPKSGQSVSTKTNSA